ncbi:MAG TPA: hypothetical protein VJ521_14845, partial [Acidobacteriota bacterium]|nr:hypothetical protein [Acidobacteriota bacterium]
MKKLFWLLLVLVMAFDTYAGRGWNDVPVTQEIADENSDFVPYYIQSDGLGAYLNGFNGDKSVLMENGFNGLKWADRLLDLNELNI